MQIKFNVFVWLKFLGLNSVIINNQEPNEVFAYTENLINTKMGKISFIKTIKLEIKSMMNQDKKTDEDKKQSKNSDSLKAKIEDSNEIK